MNLTDILLILMPLCIGALAVMLIDANSTINKLAAHDMRRIKSTRMDTYEDGTAVMTFFAQQACVDPLFEVHSA